MKPLSPRALDALWARHHGEWRDGAQVASQWEEARSLDPDLLRHSVRGRFWETLEKARATLFVTREYEHLILALAVRKGRPLVTFMRLPHPSGLVCDRARGVVHVASTRNPNQIYELRPVVRLEERLDVRLGKLGRRPLVPVSSRFYPGSTYLHDLTLLGGVLHGNAVGQNAVVRFDASGRLERVWWPRCIETGKGPLFQQNHIQLNSIAAGKDLESSFFSASSDRISTRRPSHRHYPVDGRGVIFSGASREPVARGLTRPHSARLNRGRVWVANSGYGELGFVEAERFVPVATLPGWTRGLSFCGPVAFVGTSRVIPRFSQYAPGLDLEKSRCGIHALDSRSGELLGSLLWPYGNQIFAIDWAPRKDISGFPFSLGQRGDSEKTRQLFYAFSTNKDGVRRR